MIRVLQISDSLKQRFGVTAFLMNYNSAIDTNRVVFDYLIIDTEPEIADKIRQFGGQIYTMPKLGLRNYKEFKHAIESFFKEHHYEIVHSHFYQIDSIVKNIAEKEGTKHYISHAHATKYADSRIRAIRNCAMSFPVRFTSTDFCGCSQAACDFLFGKSILKARHKNPTIIPNAIHYDTFCFNKASRIKIRELFNLKNNTIYGNIGSLKPQKNHDFLLEVFKQIKELDEKSKLMLVGDGQLRGVITEKAKRLGILDSIIFVGTSNVPQDYYNAFDCYVFPSLYEGFGISLLEAEVNGLPCVCADTVPKEPIIAKNVSVLSLKDSARKWAETCVKAAKEGRRKDNLSLQYDLTNAANKMMDYYERLSNV